MISRGLLVVALLFSLSVSAQRYSNSSFVMDTTGTTVGIRAAYDLNSTVLTNRFFFRLLNGGHISRDDTDKMLNRLRLTNNLGYEFNAGVYTAFQPDSFLGKSTDSTSFFIHLTDRQLANANLSDDATKFFLQGNKHFAGTEANFDLLDIQFARFQQLSVGTLHRFNATTLFGGSASLLIGEQFLRVNSDFLRTQTAFDGNTVSAAAAMQVWQSDTNSIGFGALNGWGFSVDLFYQKSLFTHNEHKSGTFEFEVQDLGILQWNEETIEYDVDDTYTFEGLFIDDLFSLNDSILNASQPDSIIDSVRTSGSTGTYTYYLPARVTAQFNIEQSNGWFYTIGADYRIGGNMLPRLYGWYGKQLNSRWRIAATGALGGYGMVHVGAFARYRYKSWEVLLANHNLEGLVLPMYSGGTSLVFNLAKRF